MGARVDERHCRLMPVFGLARHIAHGLVQHDGDLVGLLALRRTLDRDRVLQRDPDAHFRGLAVHIDPAAGNPVIGLAARAQTQLGQALVQARCARLCCGRGRSSMLRTGRRCSVPADTSRAAVGGAAERAGAWGANAGRRRLRRRDAGSAQGGRRAGREDMVEKRCDGGRGRGSPDAEYKGSGLLLLPVQKVFCQSMGRLMVALRLIAVQRAQAFQDIGIFHAFGYHAQAQIVRQVDGGSHNLGIPFAGLHAHHEGFVDLELLHRKAPQVSERRE